MAIQRDIEAEKSDIVGRMHYSVTLDLSRSTRGRMGKGGEEKRRGRKRLVGACFGNAHSIEGEFERRSQILTYPSLPQLVRVGLDAFDVAWRSTERMEVVPPG